MARILIVDVEKNTSWLLKSELEGIGYIVDVIQEPGPAEENMKGRACDAILINMQIPCLDYFNRLKRIRRENPQAHIVVFTSNHAPEERESLIDAGANACFARHEIGAMIAYLRHFRTVITH